MVVALYVSLVVFGCGIALGAELQRRLSIRLGRSRDFRDLPSPEFDVAFAELLPVSIKEPHSVAVLATNTAEQPLPPLLRQLRDAQDHDLLCLYFQPKLRARTGTIDSVEALVRWPHPDGNIAPDRFIELAEEHGQIDELTRWVVARGLRDRAALVIAGFDLTVYINLSARLLPDRNFANWLTTAIAGQGIGIEVTETAMISDPEGALANLRTFAEAGIRVAIDDYGAGFSSLAYLKQVPAQELKLDKMFISGLASSHRDPLLIRSTIDLAHALEMEVTAEGVESGAELALLRIMGCDLMQGFFISRPLALDALIPYLEHQRQDSAIAVDKGFTAFSGFGLGA